MDRSELRSPTARALDRLRFALERLMLRGLRYRLLLAAAIVAIVALVAGALVVQLEPESSELGEAVWFI